MKRTVPSPLQLKLSARFALSDEELTIIHHFERCRRTFLTGQELIHEGQGNLSAFILSKGWAFSYKILPSGNRQIIEFQIPGDFLGLRSVLFHASDHSIEALTHIEASEVPTSEISEALLHHPRLASAVLWAVARDEAMVVEHVVDLGRRSAEERTAHFLLELGARLKLVKMADKTGYDCPLTQSHLADALGLSSVHMNRVLRHLREQGLLTFKKGRVVFHALGRLNSMTSFDSTYLDQEGSLLQ